MRERLLAFTSMHGRTILLTTLLLAMLAAGASGEALAHNPAEHAVAGCENGADVVAHENPNCHE